MSFVGKVLVVVQVVLSICFMAFAGAVFSVQTNWKDEAEQLRADLENRATEYADLEQKLNDEKDAHALALNQAEARANAEAAARQTAEMKLADANRELQATKATLDTQSSLTEYAQKDAEDRREEAARQRTINIDLHNQLDQLRLELVEIQDQLFAAGTRNERFTRLVKKIQADLVDKEKRLRNAGIDADTPIASDDDAPPPKVDGLVLQTRKSQHTSTEYVEISIGSDDGLRKGHDLLVFRLNGTGKYLGKIHLVHVGSDRAVGTVMEKAKNGVIQRGDHVATQL